jgi:hypothetical protein
VYSLGILEFFHSSNLGSTEVGFVVSGPCAETTDADTNTVTTITLSLSKNLCMIDCSKSVSKCAEAALNLLLYRPTPLVEAAK